MGLPWVRLDTSFPRNPKLLGLLGERNGKAAAFAYFCSMAYCGEQGTDGFIPAEALGLIHATRKDAALLVAAGLWIEQPGGWLIHGWAEYQPTNAEAERRRIKAQAAAQARWHSNRSNASGNARSIATSNA